MQVLPGLARGRSCKAQQPAGILVCKPKQSAVFRLYPLGGILSGPRPEHSAENLRLALARNQKNHLGGMVQNWERERDAKSLKPFHPVRRHPTGNVTQRAAPWEERSGVPIIAQAQKNQIKAWPVMVVQMKKLCQLVIVVVRGGFRLQLCADAVNVLLWNGNF